MKYTRKRTGFSMITAIVMIMLMSTVALFISSISSKLTKETTAQYQTEQALLLANSYTEYAIMAVSANERNTGNCLKTITGTYGIAPNAYTARIQISYIGTNAEIGNCGDRRLATITNTTSPLSIIIDAYIDYRDFDNPTGPNISYHRRTIQKI